MISLCMIVKNEEKYLKDCLESVRDVVDEIIIVDTGSSDKTVNIAEAYNATIHTFEWIDDFSAARNFSISKASHDWILYLDADERLTSQSKKDLSKYTELKGNFAVLCYIKSYDKATNSINIIKYPRLFRKSAGIRFEGRVHEQIDDSIKKYQYSIVDSPIEITHIGYDITKELKKEKARRNLDLLLKDNKEKANTYTLFQLGQTYSILEDALNAKKCFEKLLADNNLTKEYKAYAYSYLANFEMKQHNMGTALNLLKSALTSDSTQPYMNFLASKIYARLNKNEEAFIYLKKALEYNNYLQRSNRTSPLDVLLKTEQIIYNGLSLAITLRHSKNMLFFTEKLENLQKKGVVNENTIKYITKLLRNDDLGTEDFDKLKMVINNENIDLFINILNSYKNFGTRWKILITLADIFNDNIPFMNLYAYTMSEVSLDDEAINVLEQLLKREEKEPSTAFYLISLYLKQHEISKASNLIVFIRKEFGNIPEVMKRIAIIESKLDAIINNKRK